MKPRRPHRAARGFTLVEVLVALFVMAVMAAMAWQGIDAVARSREVAREAVERTLRIGTVLAQWQADLGALHAVASPTAPPLTLRSQNALLVRDTDDAGLQIVVWAVRNGQLQRWAGPSVRTAAALQAQWMAAQQLVGNEPGQLTMLEGVAGWQTYCYDGSPNVNNCESTQNALPRAVRLVLQFADANSGTLTRDTALPPAWP